MEYGQKTEPKRCKNLLTKEDIESLVKRLKPCGCTVTCDFRKGIEEAIQKGNQKGTFKFGEIKKPTYTFGK